MKKSQLRLLQSAIEHQGAGRVADAIKVCRRILADTPNNFDCVYLLAILYVQEGNLGAAVAMFRRASDLRPSLVEVLYNLAVALGRIGNHEEAAKHYRQILQAEPDHVNARNNYAASLLKTEQYDDAITQYNELIAANPNVAEAYVNRGIALQNLKRFDEALADYDRAITLKPNYAEAYLNRGNVLKWVGHADEAYASYDKAVMLRPDLAEAYNARMSLSDWRNFNSTRTEIMALAKRNPTEFPFAILAISSFPQDQLECGRTYCRVRFPAAAPMYASEPYRHDRIRVGYVSADIREHPVAQLVVGMFECHDRSRFDVTCISISHDDQSALRERLKGAFEHFVDGSALSDDELAARIRNAEIDILVDMNGFTHYSRTAVFARRPAPVQVNYLGYPGSMGAEFIDYIIADRTIIPPSHRAYYAEKVVSMPDTYQSNDGKRVISDKIPTRADAGLPEAGFVFCCFNHNYKILPNVFDCWMRVLGQVQGSVLWLYEDNISAAANLKKEAAARGIDAGRLIFAKRLPLSEHLARHRLANLLLDTLPYNAHTTGSDALWAGLPVLTQMGDTFAGRVAASLLNAIRLPELITHTQDDYEKKAVAFANDPAMLAAVKAKLAQNRLTTPLFDTQAYTRHFESALEAMHKRYQLGLPPDHIDVPSLAISG